MIRDLFRTALTHGTVLGATSTLGPLAVAASLADETWSDPVIQLWARSLLRAAGVHPQAWGLDHLPVGPAVYVCNHQSHFDAVLIVAQVRRHLRFVAKQELGRIPLFGTVMRAVGNVEVDRSGGKEDRDKLTAAVRAVQAGTSLLFFAEGTRSADGELRPFKKGAAILALQAGVPIVPLAVAGTQDILRKGSVMIQGGCTAALAVGPPLPTAGLSFEDRDTLTLQAHAAVAALLNQARGQVARSRQG